MRARLAKKVITRTMAEVMALQRLGLMAANGSIFHYRDITRRRAWRALPPPTVTVGLMAVFRGYEPARALPGPRRSSRSLRSFYPVADRLIAEMRVRGLIDPAEKP